jgi:hypothetical protein
MTSEPHARGMEAGSPGPEMNKCNSNTAAAQIKTGDDARQHRWRTGAGGHGLRAGEPAARAGVMYRRRSGQSSDSEPQYALLGWYNLAARGSVTRPATRPSQTFSDS